jgi:hypothetical protein
LQLVLERRVGHLLLVRSPGIGGVRCVGSSYPVADV